MKLYRFTCAKKTAKQTIGQSFGNGMVYVEHKIFYISSTNLNCFKNLSAIKYCISNFSTGIFFALIDIFNFPDDTLSFSVFKIFLLS